MFKNRRKAVAASVACILVLGLAAYARMDAQPPKNRANMTKREMLQKRSERRVGEQAQWKLRHGCAYLSLQRFLRPPGKAGLRRMAAAIGLTEQQREQIKQLYQQFFEASKPVMARRGEAVKEFMAAWQSPSLTEGQRQSLSQPILQADSDILDVEFDFWLGLRGILNNEQQAKFSQFMQMRARKGIEGARGDEGRRYRPPAP